MERETSMIEVFVVGGKEETTSPDFVFCVITNEGTSHNERISCLCQGVLIAFLTEEDVS